MNNEIDMEKSYAYCRNCLHLPVCDRWPALSCNCLFKLTNTRTTRTGNKSTRLWVSFLQYEFHVSRRTAKDMYHALCVHKGRDNFRKQFDGGTNK